MTINAVQALGEFLPIKGTPPISKIFWLPLNLNESYTSKFFTNFTVLILQATAPKPAEALGENKLWVYVLHDRRGRSVTWLTHESIEKKTLELLKRRPCRVVDISAFR